LPYDDILSLCKSLLPVKEKIPNGTYYSIVFKRNCYVHMDLDVKLCVHKFIKNIFLEQKGKIALPHSLTRQKVHSISSLSRLKTGHSRGGTSLQKTPPLLSLLAF